MFDIDGGSILTEYEPDAYMLSAVLDGLPSWCPIVHSDKVINGFFNAMRFRIDELLPQPEEDVEKFLVIGFSKPK